MQKEILIGVGLILFGIIILFFLLKLILKALSTKNWIFTNAKIIHSDIHAKSTYNSNSNRSSTQYSIKIIYEYEVKGKKYKSDKIHWSGNGSTNSILLAQYKLEKYPIDSTKPAYYNPQNPYEAVLEKGAKISDYLFILIPIVFIGVGIFILMK